jgi:hypothetical protein
MPLVRGAPVDRMLRPVHRLTYGDSERHVRKRLRFAEVESAGGRDSLRATEVTPEPLLHRLYLARVIDELHRANLFLQRVAAALLQARSPARSRFPTRAGCRPGTTASTTCVSKESLTSRCSRSCTATGVQTGSAVETVLTGCESDSDTHTSERALRAMFRRCPQVLTGQSFALETFA